MNEQAIQDAYLLFKGKGYKKGVEEFKTLMATNPQALNDAFILFQGKGYKKGIEDFSVLMGAEQQQAPDLEKKSTDGTMELPSEDGSLEPSETPVEPTETAEEYDDGTFLRDYYPPDDWRHDLGVALDAFKSRPGAPTYLYEAIDDFARAIGGGGVQADLVDAAADMLYTSDISDLTDEQLQSIIDLSEKRAKMPISDAMRRWNRIYEEEEDPGFLSMVKAVWDNPRIAPEIIISSLAGLTSDEALKYAGGITAAGATKGALVGTAAGPGGTLVGTVSGGIAAAPYAMAVANGFTESTITLVDLLKDSVGEDWDVEKIRDYLSEEENYNSLRRRALTRGAVIGVVDALSAKLGGKVFRKITDAPVPKGPKLDVRLPKTTATSRVAGTAGATGVDMLGGGLGEALGQISIGEEADLGESFLEGLGEGGGAVFSVPAAAIKKGIFVVNGIGKTEAEFQEYIRTAKPEDIAAADIEVFGPNKKTYEEAVGVRLRQADAKREAQEMYPSLSESDIDKIVELDTELGRIENKKGRAAENKRKNLQERIDEITSQAEEVELKEEVRVQEEEKPGVAKPEEETRTSTEIDQELSDVESKIEEAQNTITSLQNKRREETKKAAKENRFDELGDIIENIQSQIDEQKTFLSDLNKKKSELQDAKDGLVEEETEVEATPEEKAKPAPKKKKAPTKKEGGTQLDLFSEDEKTKEQKELLGAFDERLKSKREELKKEYAKKKPSKKRIDFLKNAITSISRERRFLLEEMGLAEKTTEAAPETTTEAAPETTAEAAPETTTKSKPKVERKEPSTKKKETKKTVVSKNIDDQISQLQEDLKNSESKGDKKQSANIKRRITNLKKKKAASEKTTPAKERGKVPSMSLDKLEKRLENQEKNLSRFKEEGKNTSRLEEGIEKTKAAIEEAKKGQQEAPAKKVEDSKPTKKRGSNLNSLEKTLASMEKNLARFKKEGRDTKKLEAGIERTKAKIEEIKSTGQAAEAAPEVSTSTQKKRGRKSKRGRPRKNPTDTTKPSGTKPKVVTIAKKLSDAINAYLEVSNSDAFKSGDADAVAKYRKLFAAAKNVGRELGLSELEQTEAMKSAAQNFKPKRQRKAKKGPVSLTKRIQGIEKKLSDVVSRLDSKTQRKKALEAEGKDTKKIEASIERDRAYIEKTNALRDKLILESRKKQSTQEQQETREAIDSFMETSEKKGKLKQALDKAAKTLLGDKRRKAAIRSQVKRAAKAISKVLPGIKFIVHESAKSYADAIQAKSGLDSKQRHQVEKNEKGSYYRKSQEIHINLEIASLTTVAHEVFHALLGDRLTKGQIAEAVADMLPALKKVAKGDLKAKLDEFSKKYAGRTKEDQKTAEELIELIQEARDNNDEGAIAALQERLADVNEEYIVELFGYLSANYETLSAPEKGVIRSMIDKLLAMLKIRKMPEGLSDNDRAVVGMLNTLSQKVREGEVISEDDVLFGEQGAGLGDVGPRKTQQSFEEYSESQKDRGAEQLGAKVEFVGKESTPVESYEISEIALEQSEKSLASVIRMNKEGLATNQMVESRYIDFLENSLTSEILYDKIPEGQRPEKRKSQAQFKYMGQVEGKAAVISLEPVEITQKPIGSYIDQQDGMGICDGTCGHMTTRLESAGLPFGKAHIPDVRANYHAVALTLINGERYIVDQPQSEFIGEAIAEAPLYERGLYYAPYQKFNRHFPNDMNVLMNALGEDAFQSIFGVYVDEEFGDEFGPYFDVQSREFSRMSKDYDGNPESLDVIVGVSKSDPNVTIRMEVNSELEIDEINENEVYNLESFEKGEKVLVFTETKMTPRVIKATEKNLIDEYGLTEREAKVGMEKINEAAIKPSLEDRKRQLFAKSVWTATPEINRKGSYGEYLQYLNQIFPKSILKETYVRGTYVADEAIERGDFAGRPSEGLFFGYPKGRFLDYPRGKYFTLDEEYAEEFGVPVPAMLDVRNPYIDMTRRIADIPENLLEGTALEMVEGKLVNVEIDFEDKIVSPYYIKKYLPSYDAVMGLDAGQSPREFDPEKVTAVVFNSKQVHILGTKKDIDGFSKYVGEERKTQFEEKEEKDYNQFDRLYVENLRRDYEKARAEGEEALDAFRIQAVKTHRQVYGSLNAGPDFPYAEILSKTTLKNRLDSYGVEDIERSRFLDDYTTLTELTQASIRKEREQLEEFYYYDDFINGDYLTEDEKLIENQYIEERKSQSYFGHRDALNNDNVVLMGDVIVPIGISGSGKSTWVRTLPKEFVVVSPDDIRRELTGDVSDQSRNREVFQEVDKRIGNLLEQGKKIVLDATNLNTKLRKEFVEKTLSQFPERNLTYKLFPSNPKISKARIKSDISQGVDRSNVPDFVIDRQHDMFAETLKSLDSERFSNNMFRGLQAELPSNSMITTGNIKVPAPLEMAETDSERPASAPYYSAVFVNVDNVVSKYGQVHENLYSHHSTIKFQPKSVKNLPIGKRMSMKVLGRLTTDKVDVLVVDNPLSTNKYPHITLSTAKGVKPSESNNALAENQDKVVPLNDTLDGIVGFVDTERKDITTPPTEERKAQNFVGKVGLSRLAKNFNKLGASAMKDYLTATIMEKNGDTPEKILNVTRWQRGNDGKWRFGLNAYDVDRDVFTKFVGAARKAKDLIKEWQDSQEVYNTTLIANGGNVSAVEVRIKKAAMDAKEQKVAMAMDSLDRNYSIEKLLGKNNPLVKMYARELGNMVFVMEEMQEGDRAYFTSQRISGKTFYKIAISDKVDPSLSDKSIIDPKSDAISIDMLLPLLSHEIQHFVQKIEGFEQGASGTDPSNLLHISNGLRKVLLAPLAADMNNSYIGASIDAARQQKDIVMYVGDVFKNVMKNARAGAMVTVVQKAIASPHLVRKIASIIDAPEATKYNYDNMGRLNEVLPTLRNAVRVVIKEEIEIGPEAVTNETSLSRSQIYDAHEALKVFDGLPRQVLDKKLERVFMHILLRMDSISLQQDPSLDNFDDLFEEALKGYLSDLDNMFLDMSASFTSIQDFVLMDEAKRSKMTDNEVEKYFEPVVKIFKDLKEGMVYGFKDKSPHDVFMQAIVMSYTLSFGEGMARFVMQKVPGGPLENKDMVIADYLMNVDEQIQEIKEILKDAYTITTKDLMFRNSSPNSPPMPFKSLPIPSEVADKSETRKQQNYLGLDGLNELAERDSKLGLEIANKLSTALNLSEMVNESPEEILNLTGWQKGKDGRWRYAVNPYETKIAEVGEAVFSFKKAVDSVSSALSKVGLSFYEDVLPENTSIRKYVEPILSQGKSPDKYLEAQVAVLLSDMASQFEFNLLDPFALGFSAKNIFDVDALNEAFRETYGSSLTFALAKRLDREGFFGEGAPKSMKYRTASNAIKKFAPILAKKVQESIDVRNDIENSEKSSKNLKAETLIESLLGRDNILFKAYPALRRVQIKFGRSNYLISGTEYEKGRQNPFSYDKKINTIFIDNTLLLKDIDSEESLGVVDRQISFNKLNAYFSGVIQRLIQASEGFAQYGDVDISSFMVGPMARMQREGEGSRRVGVIEFFLKYVPEKLASPMLETMVNSLKASVLDSIKKRKSQLEAEQKITSHIDLILKEAEFAVQYDESGTPVSALERIFDDSFLQAVMVWQDFVRGENKMDMSLSEMMKVYGKHGDAQMLQEALDRKYIDPDLLRNLPFPVELVTDELLELGKELGIDEKTFYSSEISDSISLVDELAYRNNFKKLLTNIVSANRDQIGDYFIRGEFDFDLSADFEPEMAGPADAIMAMVDNRKLLNKQIGDSIKNLASVPIDMENAIKVRENETNVPIGLRNEYLSQVIDKGLANIQVDAEVNEDIILEMNLQTNLAAIVNAINVLMYHEQEVRSVEENTIESSYTKRFFIDDDIMSNENVRNFVSKYEKNMGVSIDLTADDLIVLDKFSLDPIYENDNYTEERKRQVGGGTSPKTAKDIQSVLDKGRAAGFKDSDLRDYMMRVLGFSATDIDNVLKDDLSGMPSSFANIKGGKEKGEELFNKVKAYRDRLIKMYSKSGKYRLTMKELQAKTAEFAKNERKKYPTIAELEEKVSDYRKKLESAKKKLGTKELNDKVGEYRKKIYQERNIQREKVNEAIVDFIEKESFENSKRPKRKNVNEIMDMVLDFLEQQKEFKDEADFREVGSVKKGTKMYIPREGYSDVQTQMLSDLQKAFGISPTKAVFERLLEAKEKMRQRMRGQAQIADVQKALMNAIRTSLPKGLYRDKRVIKLMKTVLAAKPSNIESVLESVSEFITEQNVDIVLRDIDKILKRKYYTIRSGRKVGTAITPEAESIINKVRALLPKKQTVEAAEDAINLMAARINELNKKGFLSDEEISEMSALDIAISIAANRLMDNSDITKLASLSNTLESLQAIVDFGASELTAEVMAENARFREFLNIGLQEIAGKKIDGLDSTDPDVRKDAEEQLKSSVRKAEGLKDMKRRAEGIIKRLFNDTLRGLNEFTIRHEALYGLVDRVTNLTGDIVGGQLQERITNRLDEAGTAYKFYKLQNDGIIKGKLEELFGKKYKKEMRSFRKVEVIKGIYKNEAEVKAAIDKYNSIKNPTKADKIELNQVKAINSVAMSPDQMYYWYNQYKDPANHASFANEEMFGSLENAEKAMKTIENLLETKYPKLKEFADWQVNEFFPSLYDRYNSVYRSVYKTDMPWNQFYAGRIYREGMELEPISLLGDVNAFQNSVTASSTKVRTRNNLPIKMMHGTDVLNSYLQDMEYFFTHAEAVREIDRFVKNPMVKRAIEARGGSALWSVLDNTISEVAGRGKGSRGDTFVNIMNKVFILSRLALSPVIMLKQLTSAIAYADNIGYRNWVAQIANVSKMRSTIKEIKENSAYMQDRKNDSIFKAIDTFKDGGEVSAFIPNQAQDFIINFMMWTTKFGDATAIYAGGAPNYLYYKKQFMQSNPNATEQQAIDHAIKLFERDTKRAQQSGDIVDKDYFQNSNPVYRALNMFLTTPRQYMRKEMFAIRNLYRKISALDADAGEGSVRDNLRTFVTYHVVLPALFQFIASGMPGLLRDWREEDDDDMLRATIMGNLNAFFAVGEIIQALGDYLIDKPWAGENSKTLGLVMSSMSAIQKFKRADGIKDPVKKKKAETDAIVELISVTPVPARTVQKGYENVRELQKGVGDPGEAILRIFNYSEYQISGPEKRSAGNSYDFEAEEARYKKAKEKEMKKGFGGGFDDEGFDDEGFDDEGFGGGF